MDELTLHQLEQYVDGTLDQAQRREFEKRLSQSAELREAINRQRMVDSSLRRQFSIAGAGGAKALLNGLAREQESMNAQPHAEPVARKQRQDLDRPRWLRRLAIAAVFGAAIIAVWANRSYYFPSSTFRGGPSNPIAIEKFYRDAVAAGFNPTLSCKDNNEFAATVRNRFGQALAFASTPTTVSVKGLADCRLFSEKTLAVLVTVEGREVVLLVDDVESDAHGRLSSACKLQAFEMALGNLKVVEVTPLAESRILSLLHNPDAPGPR